VGDGLLAELRKLLEGEVIGPQDPAYDEARTLWNGMIDRRPAIIARCRTAADVASAVVFARERGLTVAVRGGGHNVAGLATADDGLVLDLSAMNEVTVDPDRRVARAGPGARLGDLDAATQAHGLATSMGVVSQTGIAGLTLSGGMGWLRRKHGLSCDNLISAEVVTATGDVITASEDENADLLWGLRGGGGNFGVVTSFAYRLHAVGPEVMFCFVLYPGDRSADALRTYAGYMAEAPDEVSPLAFLGRVPRADAFPADWHGKPYAAIAAMYAGPVDEGERALEPLRSIAEPIVDMSAPMLYGEAQKILDEDYPDGWRYYWKSIALDGLTDEVIDAVVELAAAAPSDHSTIDVWYHGGAMSRVGASETAYGDRSAPILIAPEANWEEPADDDANVAWARRVVEDMRRFPTGGTYLNFPGFLEEGERLLREAFGGNYDRLVALKDRFDPGNLFRVNQNIRPSGG
jgi:FAD/FMN-containing dehydrogenase